MSEKLLSVGLDVGTTTTQLIVSSLQAENKASGFAVPEMEITDRTVLYESPVILTPMLDAARVDGKVIADFVTAEYEKAGIRREQVDTGAIIITGETSRKENAQVVLNALSSFAGEFVVATAGPDLESVLSAKGAGAVAYSEKTGATVLHMDIGGGTSNLSLIENGQILRTGCFNVGGRLIKLENGELTYVSPVVKQVFPHFKKGQIPELIDTLVAVLEMAAGLRPPSELVTQFETQEADRPWEIPQGAVTISFSGGVADCIDTAHPDFAYGDIGPQLGQAIKNSRLCQGKYVLGEQTIRATVIGAGCHSAKLSGSTVFFQNVTLPVKNLPVAVFSLEEQAQEDFSKIVDRKAAQFDTPTVVLALDRRETPGYGEIKLLAKKLAECKVSPLYIAVQADMAKALGQAISLYLPGGSPCLCIDSVALGEGSFLDIGFPVGPALPVVIKTLVLQGIENAKCKIEN